MKKIKKRYVWITYKRQSVMIDTEKEESIFFDDIDCNPIEKEYRRTTKGKSKDFIIK